MAHDKIRIVFLNIKILTVQKTVKVQQTPPAPKVLHCPLASKKYPQGNFFRFCRNEKGSYQTSTMCNHYVKNDKQVE